MITYIITGVYYNSSKRFHMKTQSHYLAMTMNLWKGSIWEVKDGKRKLLKRVRG